MYTGLPDATLLPIRDFVVLKRPTPPETTKSGLLWLPDTVKDQWIDPHLAEVAACGPNVTQVKVGDVVVFDPQQGYNYGRDGLVMSEKHLLAVVESL